MGLSKEVRGEGYHWGFLSFFFSFEGLFMVNKLQCVFFPLFVFSFFSAFDLLANALHGM